MKNLVQITTKENNALQMSATLTCYRSNVKRSLFLVDEISNCTETTKNCCLILIIPAKAIKIRSITHVPCVLLA